MEPIEIEKELARQDGRLRALSFIVRCLLMDNPGTARHLQEDLLRVNRDQLVERIGEDAAEAYLTELRTHAALPAG